MFDLAAGFVFSQTLAGCLELDLFARLHRHADTADALAAEHGLAAAKLAALLDAAVALRLLARTGARYRLGPLGAGLVGNPAVTMLRHHALLYRDLADPIGLLRAGQGTELSQFWRYPASTPDAAQASPYTALMAATQPTIAAEILDAYPVRRHRVWLDVGGGDGTFVRAALARTRTTRFILADLPGVLAHATAADRLTLAPLDLRQDGLPTGADGASLIRVLHDHDDATALLILRATHAALPPGGTLLVAEPMANTAGAESVGAYFSLYLLAMGSGRPRTAAELRMMLQDAGFTAIHRRRTRLPLLASILSAHRM